MLWVLQQIEPHFLGYFAYLLEIGVEGDADLQLHDRPVAAVVCQVLDLAKRDRMQRTAMVTKPKRAEGYVRHRASGFAHIDILANPECVIEEKKTSLRTSITRV